LRPVNVASGKILAEHRHNILLDGPETALKAGRTLATGNAVHELWSTAAKYGVLCSGRRRTVRWKFEPAKHFGSCSPERISRQGLPGSLAARCAS
jgi:two-component sensor histidine kinase